jgi:YbbR domain-containing protein
VPIRPLLIGAPAPGFEVGTVTADPSVVTLRGAPEVLAAIAEVLTEPISLSGTNATLRATGTLVLPDGARLADPAAAEPAIVVQIRETVATRTLLLGLVCSGAPSGSACLPQIGQVAVTVSGTVSDLDALDVGDLTATLDVSGLGPGDHLVQPTVALPGGVTLVTMSPISVTVTIVPPATPAP